MTEIERASAGFQMVMPGCERRTLPKSTTRADDTGQGLLHFYRPPSLHEKLQSEQMRPCVQAEDKRRHREVVYSIRN